MLISSFFASILVLLQIPKSSVAREVTPRCVSSGNGLVRSGSAFPREGEGPREGERKEGKAAFPKDRECARGDRNGRNTGAWGDDSTRARRGKEWSRIAWVRWVFLSQSQARELYTSMLCE